VDPSRIRTRQWAAADEEAEGQMSGMSNDRKQWRPHLEYLEKPDQRREEAGLPLAPDMHWTNIGGGDVKTKQ
jgi:hypothetical protein